MLTRNVTFQIWKNYVKEAEVTVEDKGPSERTVSYKKVIVTEVTDDLHVFAQEIDNGPKLEKLTEDLHNEFLAHPPTVGAYTPKRGDIIAAKYTADNCWYRAKVTKIESKHNVELLFIDYGNSEIVGTTALAVLPTACQGLPPQAKLYALAYVNKPSEVSEGHIG